MRRESDKTLPLPNVCLECDHKFVPTMDRREGRVQLFCSARCRQKYKAREWRQTHPGYDANLQQKLRDKRRKQGFTCHGTPTTPKRRCCECREWFQPKSSIHIACSKKCATIKNRRNQAEAVRRNPAPYRAAYIRYESKNKEKRREYHRKLCEKVKVNVKTAVDLGLVARPKSSDKQTRSAISKAIEELLK